MVTKKKKFTVRPSNLFGTAKNKLRTGEKEITGRASGAKIRGDSGKSESTQRQELAASNASAAKTAQANLTSQLRPQGRANIGLDKQQSFRLPELGEGSSRPGAGVLLPGRSQTVGGANTTRGTQVNPDGTPLSIGQQLANLSAGQISAAFGIAGIQSTITSVAAVTSRTAVQKSTQVGTINLLKNTIRGGTATSVAVNSATTAKTTSWITKLSISLRNPKLIAATIAGGLVGAIGSYPFAGFIKEEALQTLSFATKVAIENNDELGFEEAVQFQEEILNPDLFDKIKAGVPFANVLDSLDNFFEAAQIKLSVDKKLFADRKIQLETGATTSQMQEKNSIEEQNQYQANIDYYNEQRKLMIAYERAATIDARNEDAAFWAKEREKQRKLEEEDRKAIAAFWEAYRKEQQKKQEDSRPSKLNFGLL